MSYLIERQHSSRRHLRKRFQQQINMSNEWGFRSWAKIRSPGGRARKENKAWWGREAKFPRYHLISSNYLMIIHMYYWSRISFFKKGHNGGMKIEKHILKFTSKRKKILKKGWFYRKRIYTGTIQCPPDKREFRLNRREAKEHF